MTSSKAPSLGFIGEDLGTITIENQLENTFEVHHFYTCAHCSASIIIDAKRTRDRVRCRSCWRVICEKSELCRTACTPLNELAEDGFSASKKWTALLPAIMSGASTVKEAQDRKLILPGDPGWVEA